MTRAPVILRRLRRAAPVLAALALTLAGGVALLGPGAPPPVAALGAPAAAAPQRVVAAGGVITEILYALGAGGRVVAVDATSLHPPEALQTKPSVGYVRALSPEGLLSVRPDLVLAVDSAGPPDALRLVEDAGVPVRRVPEALTPEAVAERVRALGRLVGQGAAGEALARDVEARFARLAAAREARKGAPTRALFVLSLQNGRAIVGGRGTAADAMLGLAGLANAASAVDGYKPMGDEAILASRPDLVVAMARGSHALTPETVFGLAAFAGTPAAARRALASFDGLYLLGFGPRAPDAALDLLEAADRLARPAAAAP